MAQNLRCGHLSPSTLLPKQKAQDCLHIQAADWNTLLNYCYIRADMCNSNTIQKMAVNRWQKVKSKQVFWSNLEYKLSY